MKTPPLLLSLLIIAIAALSCASAEDAVETGDEFFYSGQSEEAIPMYTKAIEIDPEYAAAYVRRALARLAQADYDGAVADMDAAHKLIDPQLIHAYTDDMRSVYFRSGVAYYDTGLYDDAIILFDKAVAVVPSPSDYPATYFHRGMAHYRKGSYRRAIADFDMLIGLEQDYPDAAHYRRLAQERLAE